MKASVSHCIQRLLYRAIVTNLRQWLVMFGFDDIDT